MRVLVTGATGFLGRHLVPALVDAGHEVALLKRRTSKLDALVALPGLTAHDVEDAPAGSFGGATPPEAVIHAATDYGRDPARPLATFWANEAMPMRLLEAACGAGAAFLNIDTFFNDGAGRYAHLGDYTLSKRHFQEWGRQLGGQGIARFANLRLHHLYGPGDGPGKFVPSIVRRCLAGESVDLTDGRQERDFIHVSDAVAAILAVLRAEAPAGAGYRHYDVGTGESVPVRTFVMTVNELAGGRAELRFGALPTREGEFARACADPAALHALGWSPATNLRDGILSVIAAADSHHDHAS